MNPAKRIKRNQMPSCDALIRKIPLDACKTQGFGILFEGSGLLK